MKKLLLSMLVAMFMATGPAWAGEVNINAASVKQLTKVHGIGKKTAARIVAYRDEHGTFKSVEGLLQVKGIGKKTLTKMKDELTVSDSEE